MAGNVQAHDHGGAENFTANILPFPLVRRHRFLAKQARMLARLEPVSAANNLTYQLEVQRKALLRRGVDPIKVESELAALDGAIRAAVWRLAQFSGAGL